MKVWRLAAVLLLTLAQIVVTFQGVRGRLVLSEALLSILMDCPKSDVWCAKGEDMADFRPMSSRVIPSLLFVGAMVACGAEDEAPAERCDQELITSLNSCVAERSVAVYTCLSSADCSALDGSLQTLRNSVLRTCRDKSFGKLSAQDLADRVASACASHTDSMGWRVFGGPHAAVWKQSDAKGKACLTAAHDESVKLAGASLALYQGCIKTSTCDVETLSAARASLVSSAVKSLEAPCGKTLAERIAIDAELLTKRVGDQVDCLVASVTPADNDLGLSCGPGNAQFTAKRGEWVKVPVDSAVWGTRCGDGSDYAFYVRLAPEGQPLDKIFIGLQGGGVCVFEEDCTAKKIAAPGLFTAQDDMPLGTGIASDDPTVSRFANWTKVYMPYCTQDVFAGGGITEDLGDLQLPRYGSVNLRASVRMLRDLLWKMKDAEDGAGWRDDKVKAFVGGWSAGSYGTLYNYHWFLDDLRWPQTTAFPDAGMALDNGELLGVKGLGDIKIPMWGTLPQLPPYCFAGKCALGPVLLEALSPRLKRVPMQQVLVLSNPKDKTQMNDAYFKDEAKWVNAMRLAVCETRDLPGVAYYLTSTSTADIHVVTLRPTLWNGSIDGETMKAWFERAIDDPDTITTRVEEADFVKAIPGVKPFPCKVSP